MKRVSKAKQEEEGRRYLITSALPYINGVKHLGNLVGSLLPADVYARFLRQRGEDVLFVCGTDEHGTPAELGAEAEGLQIEEYCRKYWRIQSQIYDAFGISFDYFGRTSSRANHETTQEVFLRLWERELIQENRTRQIYCVEDERYLPDRFINGTCPACGSDKARGDQCEDCTTMLDPCDLIEPRCYRDSAHTLEFREELHLFLCLQKMQSTIATWLAEKSHWPVTTLGIARGFLGEGLHARCITRNLKWGVPVPREGFEDKVFYVWFDAPIGYIGISKEWAEQDQSDPDAWRRYWKDPSTRLVQFMAKDNVVFHTITWPATMLGADDDWVTAWMVKGFHWLNYEGNKFSTSARRGVFTDVALELFPADYWRYYLLSIAPEKADTSFTWEGFQSTVNKDLGDVLGNLLSRVTRFIHRFFDGRVPELGLQGRGPEEVELLEEFGEHARLTAESIESCRFSAGIRSLRAAWASGNKYFDNRAPWGLRKSDPAACGTVLHTSVHLLRRIAVLSHPVIPHLAEGIARALGLPADFDFQHTSQGELGLDDLAGLPLAVSGPSLVKKIDDELIMELRRRFAGK